MKERRKFVRADAMSNIKWSREQEQAKKKTSHHDITKNVGGGGVCIIAKEKIDIGDRIKLEITLPNHKPIHAKGKVVWVKEFEIGLQKKITKGYYVGVEFIDISEEDRRLVELFVLEYFSYMGT